jgi:hypothetical protein
MHEVGKSPHVQSREQALAIAYAKERGRAEGGDVQGRLKRAPNRELPSRPAPMRDLPDFPQSENIEDRRGDVGGSLLEGALAPTGYNSQEWATMLRRPFTSTRETLPARYWPEGYQAGGRVYETPLSREEESRFQDWKQRYAPRDSGEDYDLRGAFKAGVKPDPRSGHWPDTYKKPNHPTFSDQSKYALPGMAGRWDGESYSPAPEPFQAGGEVGGLVDHDRDPELPRTPEAARLVPMMPLPRGYQDPAYIGVIQRLIEGQRRLNAMQPAVRESLRRYALGGLARYFRGGVV